MKLSIKKILVPTDFSDTGMLAVDHAAMLARLTKAEMILVHVLPLNPYYFEIPEPVMLIDNRQELVKLVEQKLAHTAEKISIGDSIHPTYQVTTGRVANEVMRIAQEEKADLIIMGTHGAKGFEELFIGSNAHKIVNLAPCPVLTIQEHAKPIGFKTIVLPIDRSAHSREKVEVGITLAKIYGSGIHILGLLESSDEGEYDKLQIVLDQVEHAVDNGGIPFSRHTVKGDHLAAEALKFADSINADLIIIMTEHESKLTGIFLGPLAKQIVNHSRIPVLSLKPHYGSFESLNLGGGYSVY
jgi:nucleotide-binding universal stress UspA family protein